MNDEPTIKTNNVPRLLLDACELTAKERADFDYLDWSAIDDGSDSATFIRYRGVTYDLGEFMTTSGMPDFSPIKRWDGYHSDSFFSGILIKYCQDADYVIMATYYA